MNPAGVLSQLEAEITWRQDEMRMLHNQAQSFSSERDKAVYRKSLVVMLYSHLEGFCKEAFSIYVEAINGEGLKRSEINHSLAASCFELPFKLLRDQAHKQPFFKRASPNDPQLHQFYREITFIESLDDFFDVPVDIPVDKIVNTESNLTPTVLQKLLYRMGFDPDTLSSHAGEVASLLGNRNAIAHGRRREGIDEVAYEKMRAAAFSVMSGVKALLFDALARSTYLRSA